jgi:hypothetical protein
MEVRKIRNKNDSRENIGARNQKMILLAVVVT